VAGLKLLDQIPVSDNSKMVVNMTNPPLVLPQPNKKGLYSVPQAVTVGSQAVAQWKALMSRMLTQVYLARMGSLFGFVTFPLKER